MEDQIKRELMEAVAVKRSILQNLVPQIKELVEMILKVYKNGGRLIMFGNGGSAADSAHLIAELVNMLYLKNRPMLDALALTVNMSVLTSIANDYSYEDIFSRQVESLVTDKDIVIGISTSGNSKNVIKALHMVKERGAITVGWTGRTGGKMANMELDMLMRVNSDDVARIQEGHMVIGHIMCSLVEKELFLNEKVKIKDGRVVTQP